MRAYVVRIAPGGTVQPALAHKGVELVLVADGLVQVVLSSGRPVLRSGEALLVDRGTIAEWRNLGDRRATAFWVIRDERR
jgi:quercetin dioxygenase-like cupin family protein